MENKVQALYADVNLHKQGTLTEIERNINLMVNSEDSSSSTILYIAIAILFSVVVVLVISIVIIFKKKTQKQVTDVKPSPVAQNR